jgi:hypothetical protein
VLLLHHEVERIQEYLALPGWGWLAIGAIAIFLITRLHEGAVHLADRYFNRELDRTEDELERAMLKARKPVEIDRLLADEAYRRLNLTSAAVFRREGPVFARNGSGKGWRSGTAETLAPDAPLLAPLPAGKPFSLADCDDGGSKLPPGLSRPVLAVPAVNPLRCFAVSLYGPHASGTDLDANERAMLARLAGSAAAIYAELETGELRRTVVRLERRLSAAKPRGTGAASR